MLDKNKKSHLRQPLSPFVHIMCWCAGVDVERIVNHKNDIIKYSVIGATITTTALIAFVSGYCAAWYFSNSIFASLCFGLFWATLIFCIDRALVVTFKKDPTLEQISLFAKIRSSLVVLVPRALLAGCVAFMMSIPMELLIFEDFIKNEKDGYIEYKKKKSAQDTFLAQQNQDLDIERQRNDASLNANESWLNNVISEKETKIRKCDELQSKVNSLNNGRNTPSTPTYQRALIRKRNAESELHSTKNLSSSRQSELNGIIFQAKSTLQVELNRHRTDVDSKISQIKPQISSLKTEIADLRKREQDYNERLRRAEVQADKLIQRRDTQLEDDNRIATNVGERINSTNQFTLGYAILAYATERRQPVFEEKQYEELLSEGEVNKEGAIKAITLTKNEKVGEERANQHEWFLLWMVRCMFFIFEMLPTLVKVIAKSGTYEREVHAEEKNYARYLESQEYLCAMDKLNQIRSEHIGNLETERINLERQLHTRLLKQIADAQEEVAQRVIEQWRKEQLGLEKEREGSSYNNSTRSTI
jgi:Domain of unknown function (DUF4407)